MNTSQADKAISGIVLVICAIVWVLFQAAEIVAASGISLSDFAVLVFGPFVILSSFGTWLVVSHWGSVRSIVSLYFASRFLVVFSVVFAIAVTIACYRWQMWILFDRGGPSAEPYPYRGIVRVIGLFVLSQLLVSCLGLRWKICV